MHPRFQTLDAAVERPRSSASLKALLEAHERARLRDRPLLTNAGETYIRQQLPHSAANGAHFSKSARRSRQAPLSQALPWWDAKCRRLWLGARLLKEYLQPAPCQTRLLEMFQARDWAEVHIEDPLTSVEGEIEEDRKRRLHDTLKSLNRSMPAGTIRFRGDGTGQGVTWEYTGRSVRSGVSGRRRRNAS